MARLGHVHSVDDTMLIVLIFQDVLAIIWQMLRPFLLWLRLVRVLMTEAIVQA